MLSLPWRPKCQAFPDSRRTGPKVQAYFQYTNFFFFPTVFLKLTLKITDFPEIHKISKRQRRKTVLEPLVKYNILLLSKMLQVR